MRRIYIIFMVMVLVISVSTVCFAATVSGGGTQKRGYPGHNAELYGGVFNLPTAGRITSVTGEGTDRFWIEIDHGPQVVMFNTFNQAVGYTLPAGNYRVLPTLRDNPKADSSWVEVTFTYP